MYLNKVAPIINLPFKDSYFFYYSLDPLKQGAIVEINLKNRLLYGVVLRSEKLIKYKKILKEIPYSLKKISQIVIDFPVITSYQFLIARFLSEYYYCSLPLAFKTILPSSLKSFFSFLKKEVDPLKIKPDNISLKEEKPIITQETENFIFIEKKIKQYRLNQILFLTPTAFHSKFLQERLENSIVFQKNSGKKSFQVYKNVLEGNNSLILGNRSSIFLPFKNLKLIIIEDPNNYSYKSLKQKPYFNAIKIAQTLSLYSQSELIFYYAKN